MPDGHVIEDGRTDEPSPPADATAGSAPARVARFLVERFPPAPQLVLMATLFVAATTMSGALLAPGVGGHLGDVNPLSAACGFIGSLLFVVRLRVYDDVKDADTDRVENPTRPIPRGLVSVRELDLTGAAILVVEGLLIATVGQLALAVWTIAATWSVLMRVEFFAPTWLEHRVATYAISHMVVMGLIYGALLAIGIDARAGTASVADLFSSRDADTAMVAATIIGIGFEWGRKFDRYHAVHDELGWTLWLLWPSVGAIIFTALVRDAYPTWSVLALTTVCVLTIVGHAFVMGQRPKATRSGESEAAAAPGARPATATAPSPTGILAATVEAAPGIAGLLVYLVLAAAGTTELLR